ncbi:hypothetical protein MIZ03_0724 [Rhodoferax lithotrophicus]|uniref:Uncharacterized protein n=1 Tax=Rhodoferax lithotrophicus TaxID=2798804 RepID=A0ABM7MI07_9BURK|nr:hypothetical protein MIZ03_0724 [Rhodoferax sp. MIZ03]
MNFPSEKMLIKVSRIGQMVVFERLLTMFLIAAYAFLISATVHFSI